MSEDGGEEDQCSPGIHRVTDETIRSALKQRSICRQSSEVEPLAGEADACRHDQEKSCTLSRNDERIEGEKFTLHCKDDKQQDENGKVYLPEIRTCGLQHSIPRSAPACCQG